MGVFDILFGGQKPTRVEVTPDQIWMTTDAKFAGLARAVEARVSSDAFAILRVAHFPDVLERLGEIVRQQEWGVPCKAVPADNLDQDLAASLELDASAVIDVIVGERHPLPSVDDRLQTFADTLPCRCRFAHHVSLEDAVIRSFAGDWVTDRLQQLGASEDEPIESRLVSRRIRKAQQKIEGRVRGSLDVDSAADKLSRNK